MVGRAEARQSKYMRSIGTALRRVGGVMRGKGPQRCAVKEKQGSASKRQSPVEQGEATAKR